MLITTNYIYVHGLNLHLCRKKNTCNHVLTSGFWRIAAFDAVFVSPSSFVSKYDTHVCLRIIATDACLEIKLNIQINKGRGIHAANWRRRWRWMTEQMLMYTWIPYLFKDIMFIVTVIPYVIVKDKNFMNLINFGLQNLTSKELFKET